MPTKSFSYSPLPTSIKRKVSYPHQRRNRQGDVLRFSTEIIGSLSEHSNTQQSLTVTVVCELFCQTSYVRKSKRRPSQCGQIYKSSNPPSDPGAASPRCGSRNWNIGISLLRRVELDRLAFECFNDPGRNGSSRSSPFFDRQNICLLLCLVFRTGFYRHRILDLGSVCASHFASLPSR